MLGGGVGMVAFGSAPYLFSPGLPSVARRIISQIMPIKGIKAINNIQPLLSISCNLLTPTAKPGINTAKL